MMPKEQRKALADKVFDLILALRSTLMGSVVDTRHGRRRVCCRTRTRGTGGRDRFQI